MELDVLLECQRNLASLGGSTSLVCHLELHLFTGCLIVGSKPPMKALVGAKALIET